MRFWVTARLSAVGGPSPLAGARVVVHCEAALCHRQHRQRRSIVFNIKSNDYRLVVSVAFDKAIVWIKWIGTHRDYDRIDVKEIDHGS